MLAHTVHHAFTLVWATATAGLDAAQTHTLCCHTLYIMSLPWYRLQPLLGLTLHKHAHYAGRHSFFLSHHLCQPLGHCSCATHPRTPTSGHTQDSFHIAAHHQMSTHPRTPTSGHTQDSFHIAAHHQMSTGGDVKLLVGCRLKKTLHCCRVTSVG